MAVSSMINRSGDGERIWSEKVVGSTLRDRRIGPLIDEVVSESQPSFVKTEFGALPALVIPFRCDEIERVLIRMTKGFLRKTYPDVDASHFQFKVGMVQQFQVEEVYGSLRNLHYFELGNGVFRMWYGISREYAGIWAYLFYNSAGYFVSH
ncbi:hypothetical protein [Verrucomicrobium sp. BvORR034]|uniref:hypothetical protein n=1 Tax=Verrucomicrobium sp. BvORR034 TaxID=1396418 RepID=UPI002240FC48|nr:hypothetical protein [Verrucomicrobium sp. BvORR034]